MNCANKHLCFTTFLLTSWTQQVLPQLLSRLWLRAPPVAEKVLPQLRCESFIVPDMVETVFDEEEEEEKEKKETKEKMKGK